MNMEELGDYRRLMMSKKVKTKRHPNGIYVIPQEQVDEFNRPGGPNYRELIKDCLVKRVEVNIKCPIANKKRKWLK